MRPDFLIFLLAVMALCAVLITAVEDVLIKSKLEMQKLDTQIKEVENESKNPK